MCEQRTMMVIELEVQCVTYAVGLREGTVATYFCAPSTVTCPVSSLHAVSWFLCKTKARPVLLRRAYAAQGDPYGPQLPT